MDGIESRLDMSIKKASELGDIALKMTKRKHKEEKSENK